MQAKETANTAVETFENNEITVGDAVSVRYEKAGFGSGGYQFTGEVRDVSEPVDGIYQILVRHAENYRTYVVTVSRHGVSVSTNYPGESDNQTIGTNGTITRE